jgi:hypothetical protein
VLLYVTLFFMGALLPYYQGTMKLRWILRGCASFLQIFLQVSFLRLLRASTYVPPRVYEPMYEPRPPLPPPPMTGHLPGAAALNFIFPMTLAQKHQAEILNQQAERRVADMLKGDYTGGYG